MPKCPSTGKPTPEKRKRERGAEADHGWVLRETISTLFKGISAVLCDEANKIARDFSLT
jgi:hypothetical protein